MEGGEGKKANNGDPIRIYWLVSSTFLKSIFQINTQPFPFWKTIQISTKFCKLPMVKNIWWCVIRNDENPRNLKFSEIKIFERVWWNQQQCWENLGLPKNQRFYRCFSLSEGQKHSAFADVFHYWKAKFFNIGWFVYKAIKTSFLSTFFTKIIPKITIFTDGFHHCDGYRATTKSAFWPTFFTTSKPQNHRFDRRFSRFWRRWWC